MMSLAHEIHCLQDDNLQSGVLIAQNTQIRLLRVLSRIGARLFQNPADARANVFGLLKVLRAIGGGS
jgi:hypothetical protein